MGHNAVEKINMATWRTKISSHTMKVRNQGRREIVPLLLLITVVVVVVIFDGIIVVVVVVFIMVVVVTIIIVFVVILYDMSTSHDLIAEAVTINATITIMAPVLVAAE